MLSTLLLGLLAVLPAVGPAPVKINLTISGLNTGKGMVTVRFYDKPNRFLQTVYLQKAQLVNLATVTVTVGLG